MTTTYERFETFVPANKADSKGRQIGFVVVLADNGEDFRACVQKAIIAKPGAAYKAWGATQRSKQFKTAEAARNWAYYTAKERISKL